MTADSSSGAMKSEDSVSTYFKGLERKTVKLAKWLSKTKMMMKARHKAQKQLIISILSCKKCKKNGLLRQKASDTRWKSKSIQRNEVTQK